MKRIAVITSGGDAPGMNAAVRAVVREAAYNNLEVLGIQRGYCGLLEDDIVKLTPRSVSGIINHGGTILKTARCAEIRAKEGMNRAARILRNHGVEGLVVIGGDGSMQAGARICSHGIAVIGIPASIDNDIYGTDETIGFDTAMNTSLEAIDKIRDTATSHDRIFIVEVMGREHGFLSLTVGLASGAEFILIPEVKYKMEKLFGGIREMYGRGKTSIIIVFAEGVGNPYDLAKDIKARLALEVRVSTLGYIQRGGTPTGRSRLLACEFGAHAVRLLRKRQSARVVVMAGGRITDIPLKDAVRKTKKLDFELYQLAEHLAI